jgi:hypothetical protein
MIDLKSMKDYSSVETGKNLFFVIIGLFIVDQMVITFEQGLSPGGWLFGALVLFVIYEGYDWAKIAYCIYGFIIIAFGGFSLAILIGDNGFPRLYENGSLIYQADYTSEILMSSFLIASTVTKVAMLLFSKSINNFLDHQKLQPKYSGHQLLLPRQLPEKAQFGEKLRMHSDGKFPNYQIVTLLPILHSGDIIAMLNYDGSFKNIIRCGSDGSVVWEAELPTADDVYTNVEWKDDVLMAFSRSCISVILDVKSGKILLPATVA